jgi:protein pelota
VKSGGGEVRIFSTMHVSGEQLSQLGGIAAILRFPIPDIEDEEEEEEEKEPSNNNNNNNSTEEKN